MHVEAYEWVRRFGSADPLVVLDIGGRNINGTALDHFPHADATVLDIAPGPNVDIVADAASWVPDRGYDVVVCAEVFEHTAVWPEICATVFKALRPGGEFVVTCAGPGRAPHSAVDGGKRMRKGEWYRNVSTDALRAALADCGFVDILTDTLGEDTRAFARRPL